MSSRASTPVTLWLKASVTLPTGRRTYLVQTAEKGIAWLTVETEGTEGHGSLPHRDNAVAELSRALARVAARHLSNRAALCE